MVRRGFLYLFIIKKGETISQNHHSVNSLKKDQFWKLQRQVVFAKIILKYHDETRTVAKTIGSRSVQGKKGAQDLHLDSPATLQLRYVYHSNKQKQ